jgi:hypothetical protein
LRSYAPSLSSIVISIPVEKYIKSHNNESHNKIEDVSARLKTFVIGFILAYFFSGAAFKMGFDVSGCYPVFITESPLSAEGKEVSGGISVDVDPEYPPRIVILMIFGI